MENGSKFRPDPKLRLMDQVRQVLRYHHYAYRTEQTYCDWIMRYIRFHGSQIHPKNMGKTEIEAFLSHLAVTQKVAASTQRQALNAIVFLYKNVLDIPIQEKLEPVRAKRHGRPPVVMSQSEVKEVLGNMQGLHLLMAKLLYGGGLRLMECVRLRVRDLDFGRQIIYVRAAKGGKDRTTLFPQTLHPLMKSQVESVKKLHQADLADGFRSPLDGLERLRYSSITSFCPTNQIPALTSVFSVHNLKFVFRFYSQQDKQLPLGAG